MISFLRQCPQLVNIGVKSKTRPTGTLTPGEGRYPADFLTGRSYAGHHRTCREIGPRSYRAVFIQYSLGPHPRYAPALQVTDKPRPRYGPAAGSSRSRLV
jgi:hypothetical protein